jgi:hypothetical protein
MNHLPIDLLIFDRHLTGNHDADDWLATATACATGLMQDDVFATGSCDVFAKLFADFIAAGGLFASRRTDLNTDGIACGPLAENFFRLLSQRLESLGYGSGHAIILFTLDCQNSADISAETQPAVK